jgi:NAD dependent epimerase/dehydratase family enzyme
MMEDIRDAMNVVAPEVVRNQGFVKAIGTAVNRPTWFPVPKAARRLAVRGFNEVLFASSRVLPGVARERGYRFLYPRVDEAVQDFIAAKSDLGAA